MLAERLTQRGQDEQDVIDNRMAQAVEEMSHYVQSDFLVVNCDFDQALAELRAIITSQRLRTIRQTAALAPLLDELLR